MSMNSSFQIHSGAALRAQPGNKDKSKVCSQSISTIACALIFSVIQVKIVLVFHFGTEEPFCMRDKMSYRNLQEARLLSAEAPRLSHNKEKIKKMNWDSSIWSPLMWRQWNYSVIFTVWRLHLSCSTAHNKKNSNNTSDTDKKNKKTTKDTQTCVRLFQRSFVSVFNPLNCFKYWMMPFLNCWSPVSEAFNIRRMDAPWKRYKASRMTPK